MIHYGTNQKVDSRIGQVTLEIGRVIELEVLLFLTINAINILTYLMFVSRVRRPRAEGPLGVSTILLAIPSAVIGLINLLKFESIFSWLPAIAYVIWAIFDIIVDYVLKIQFRNPPRAAILGPFLVLFYFSTGGMVASLYRVNFYLWLISVITYALNLYGAYYAAKYGKG